MQTASIAIIGGGLSGLYATFLLEQAGVRDYVLLEARERLGGRVAHLAAGAGQGAVAERAGRRGFDLGPTWYWPEFQPALDRVVRDLGLHCVPQFDAGDMLIEYAPDQPPQRRPDTANYPVSMRLAGGMAALVDALLRRVDSARIHLGQAVQTLRAAGAGIELDSAGAQGSVQHWRVQRVLLAVPPRLAEHSLRFAPALPPDLAQQWRGTATWMAPHAKYLAVYEAPFWRAQGLSGSARSACGPLVEIHDASAPDGPAALFGFLGIPAGVRKSMPEAALRQSCRAQLAHLFGPAAAAPALEVVHDWAQERYTTTARDLGGILEHPFAPATAPVSGPWAGRLLGIGSEWSPQFPGYVASAIEAAGRGVRSVLPTAAEPTEDAA